MDRHVDNEQLDDIYSLRNIGVKIDPDLNIPKKGRLDHSHVRDEQGATIQAANVINKEDGIHSYRDATFKAGPPHSHLQGDQEHGFHLYQNVQKRKLTWLARFRNAVKVYREKRKQSRDR